jgi:23S rRNA (uracil1939-C5)-methyltransferase
MSCSRTGRRPPTKVRLVIESLAFGGDGVARDQEGRVVFVPGVAPGDEIIAVVVEEKKRYARAELERIVTPSPERVAPPCPLFEAGCGGCQWQHVSIAAQRRAKEDIVRRELRHAGTDVRPLETPAPDYRWRRRARLRWRRGLLGYTERRSHRLIDVPACPQLEPGLEAALVDVRATLLPTLEGAGELSLLLGEGGAVSVGAQEIDLGDDDVPFLARADVFAQVSAPGNAALRRLVLEAAGPLQGARVLELHAGSGNFTRDLAKGAAHLIAVEEAPEACALARRNLAARGLTVDVRAESAVKVATTVPGPFDVIVVDPPRTGLEPGLAEALRRLAPGRLVYVSCDPPTLARDLRALGMPLRHATPIDLMPQTFHVEVVASLGV